MIENLRTFYISSKTDKINPSDTDANFSVKIDIPNLDWDDITHCSISDIEIPTSYYTIYSPNNTFTFQEAGYPAQILTITPGCYTSTTLSSTISALLIAASTGSANARYGVALNNVTGLLVFTSNIVIVYSLTFPSIQLSQICGFNTGVTYLSSGIGINPIYPPNVANVAGLGVVYLTCAQVAANNNTQSASNVLCAIHNQGDSFFTYDHETYDMIYNMKRIGQKSQIWSFKLLDEFKTQLNLNGIPMSFTLHLFKYNTNVFLPIKQK